jgi:parallel beta-helix repeat protein
VANANFQGILAINASDVTITDNHVTGNNRSLQPFAVGGPVCPGIRPAFVAGEGFDCGEGIHLSGVTHSTVSNNLVDHNAGGILISDDTGPNHDNLITGNTVQDNPYDCGITLASHHFGLSPQDPNLGVYRITVTGNTSARNGLLTGEGAGVGVFTGPPGAQNWGDVIVGNTLTGNGLPGVALHSHTVFQKLTDILIAGNTISGNGPDSDPGTTVPTGIDVFSDSTGGAAAITGVVIVGNTIKGEGIDVAIKTPGEVDVHLNNFFGDVGIDNLGTGSVNATMNWWKCSNGPGSNGCSALAGAGVQVAPWLSQPSH